MTTRSLACSALFLLAGLYWLRAQSTAFTHQSRLGVSGTNYTGSAEFGPSLWDAASGGAQPAASSPASVMVGVSSYTNRPGVKHVGLMAQDFRAAFGLGEDDKHIATVDADGVALAAIQALNQKLVQESAEIEDLKARLEMLERLLDAKNGGGK